MRSASRSDQGDIQEYARFPPQAIARPLHSASHPMCASRERTEPSLTPGWFPRKGDVRVATPTDSIRTTPTLHAVEIAKPRHSMVRGVWGCFLGPGALVNSICTSELCPSSEGVRSTLYRVVRSIRWDRDGRFGEHRMCYRSYASRLESFGQRSGLRSGFCGGTTGL